MERHQGLNTIPAELVLCIFDWVCWDEIDLNMLGVSHPIRNILLSHPVIQVLAAFRIEKGRNLVEVVGNQKICETEAASASLKLHGRTRVSSIDEIMRRPWCRPAYISQLQKALLRSMIRRYWKPCLQRDGIQPEALENILAQVTRLCGIVPNRSLDDMIKIVDTATGFSWTRIHIWPHDGRAMIRDQVSNTCNELHVSLVSQIELAKQAGRVDDDNKIHFPCLAQDSQQEQ